MSSVKLSLLDNARSFLCEALEKAILAESNSTQWKFAILSLVQSIELVLKEKLRREHPVLIYQNIDKLGTTVSLEQALNRLERISKISFSQSDIKAVSIATDWRNLIVHYEFELNAYELKAKFARLLGFSAHFYQKYLESSLNEMVPVKLWDEALAIFEYSAELNNRAIERLKDEGIDEGLIWSCPTCGWDTFVFQDDINTCYVCGYTADVIECPDCREFFFAEDCKEYQTGDERFELFCENCYEIRERNDDDYWHDMMGEYCRDRSYTRHF